MIVVRLGVVVALAVCADSVVGRAADPASVQTPIQGSTATGDKNRTGPDGWSWAPITRDQVPSDKSGTKAADGKGDPNSIPNPAAGKPLAPGADPGTPEKADANGPGTIDAGAAGKP